MTSKLILIIDNEYDIRAVAELALKAVGGWQVSTAASGSEGVAKAAAEQPDVILLDMMMPDMDSTWGDTRLCYKSAQPDALRSETGGLPRRAIGKPSGGRLPSTKSQGDTLLCTPCGGRFVLTFQSQ